MHPGESRDAIRRVGGRWGNVLSHAIGRGTQTTARERPPLALPQDADGNAYVLARVPVEDPADSLGNEAGAVDITRALLRGDWGAAADVIRANATQEYSCLPPLQELAIALEGQRQQKPQPTSCSNYLAQPLAELALPARHRAVTAGPV
jgi:hypothetical protein